MSFCIYTTRQMALHPNYNKSIDPSYAALSNKEQLVLKNYYPDKIYNVHTTPPINTRYQYVKTCRGLTATFLIDGMSGEDQLYLSFFGLVQIVSLDSYDIQNLNISGSYLFSVKEEVAINVDNYRNHYRNEN